MTLTQSASHDTNFNLYKRSVAFSCTHASPQHRNMLCFWIDMNNNLKIGATILLCVIMSYSNCLETLSSSICFDLCLLLLQYNGNVVFMHEYVNVSFVCTVGQWGICENVITWPLMYLLKDFKQCFSSRRLFVNRFQAGKKLHLTISTSQSQTEQGATCSDRVSAVRKL